MRNPSFAVALAAALAAAPASAATVWTWSASSYVEVDYEIDSAFAADDPTQTPIPIDPSGLEAIGFSTPPTFPRNGAAARATVTGLGRAREVVVGPELSFRNLTDNTVFRLDLSTEIFADTNVNLPDDDRRVCDYGRVSARGGGFVAAFPRAELAVETNLSGPVRCDLTFANDNEESFGLTIFVGPGESSPIFQPTAFAEVAVVPTPPAVLALASAAAALAALSGGAAVRRRTCGNRLRRLAGRGCASLTPRACGLDGHSR